MFIDSRSISEDTIIKTDVCIIGAGAAGITLAQEFKSQPFRVALLESGGLGFDPGTQSLNAGRNIGHSYLPLEIVRSRFFGGSTNCWGGHCKPLSELDFAARSWIPHSGWPFDKSHLIPYYKRAQQICHLGPFAYTPELWESWDPTSRSRFRFESNRVISKVEQLSQGVRFGEIYKNDIALAANITTYLHANVINIETTETAKTVTRLRIACLNGNKFWVKARAYILATGGLENPRLLLLSNSVQQVGLGNQNDLVGRFFMEHISTRTGLFLLSNPAVDVDFYMKHETDKAKLRGYLSLADDVQRHEALPNIGFVLFPFILTPPQMMRVYLQPLVETVMNADIDDFGRHLGYVLADLDNYAVAAHEHLAGLDSGLGLLQLFSTSEPIPNPDSRITLASERDSLGQNRVQLDWRLSELDRQHLQHALEILATEIGRAGLGRIRYAIEYGGADWPHSLHVLKHHMGTTRMSTDAKTGVVDKNCRVHGISNLFIAGSSIFPTAGYANPTLTIVALAARLADHIKDVMKGSPNEYY